MNRREAIQKAGMMLGYALSAPAIAGVLNGCAAKPELTYAPVFFTEQQARLVEAIAETMLPRTATPGAKDAGVPAFIDAMLASVYSADQKQNFVQGLADFDKDANEKYGDDFARCSPGQQLEFVKLKNEAAVQGQTTSEGWWAAGKANERPFILTIKELTILGFFTSEPGATVVLQYNPVPGPFKGCVPLAEVGRAWAT